MKIIGITGGIASGKSNVARYLMEKGYQVIDTDRVSRSLCEPNEAGWHAIRDEFGEEYFDAEGKLDRRKLGAFVFADSDALAKLNGIMHPLIQKKIYEYADIYKDEEVVFVEGAVLIEAGMTGIFHEIWVVVTDSKTQLERVMKRDNLNVEQALNRIRAQMDIEEKKKYATYVIDSTHEKENTYRQVQQCLLESGLGRQW